ncbi:MAG: 4-diphosphocytidyl-2-C-methyl-D-erythritol kinase [uncultured Chloroflexi bacterium]|uniref:4-diphosphocytidyl-2-C-methyl-D-erythritol kinase n=1 Tax=uncultured Chloroflexota bacterium TaxID=166587 RepID=A0A6J4J948_9CHLR|nr:MAG: 4-diphosphocytidyl-2-C-methyl-D-erythritol kinase [uncultured Chloroflexota bacterium]
MTLPSSTPATSTLTVLAPAKVNLTLEVLRRREDGFHEIRSVMQRITLCDELSVSHASDLHFECSDPALAGPDNLVYRAAALLRAETGASLGARLRLVKRIPVAAGLGGGSSDAATTLAALDVLWQLRLPRERLLALAAQLGSDVPFFLAESPCALAEGRGELLTPLPSLPPRWLVLLKPDAGISAGAVYKAFPACSWSDGARTTRWLEDASRTRAVPPPFNDLELIALQVEPAAASARSWRAAALPTSPSSMTEPVPSGYAAA